MKKRSRVLSSILALSLFLTACGDIGSVENQKADSQKRENQKESFKPYISITYYKDKEEETEFPEYEDAIMYSYDIEKKKLEEKGALHIPDEAVDVGALYSKSNNKAYYSDLIITGRESSYTEIWEYDFETKEKVLLNKMDLESFELCNIIEPNQLLGMSESREHFENPAIFDVKSKKLSYLFEANNEENIYSFAPVSAQYNPGTGEIVCAYVNDEELRSEKVSSGDKSMPTYIAIASKSLVKDPKRIYMLNLKGGDQVSYVTQISENECIAEVTHFVDSPEDIEDIYYDIKFNGDSAEAKKIDNIYPNSSGWKTIDGGKNYYFSLYKDNKTCLYCYNVESGKLNKIFEPEKGEYGWTIIGEKE